VSGNRDGDVSAAWDVSSGGTEGWECGVKVEATVQLHVFVHGSKRDSAVVAEARDEASITDERTGFTDALSI
jgi:hypothetical protein